MSSFNKIVQFFLSKYYNNLKYSNRMLSATRIFFERTTNYSQTVSNLGNVYRNSKWSDLKIQNIKTSFFNQFLNIFVVFILILLFIMVLSRIGYVDTLYLFQAPSDLWYVFYDTLKYSYLYLLSVVYALYMKVNLYISNIFKNRIIPNTLTKELDNVALLKTTTNSQVKHIKYINNTQLSINRDTLLLALYLQKTVNSLSMLDKGFISFRKKNLIENISLVENYEEQVHNILYLSLSKEFPLVLNQKHSIINLEGSKILANNKTNFLKVYSQETNLAFLNSLPFNIQKIFIDNAQLNVNLSKQNRWLWKSSLLSDKIVLKMSTVTHLKKLYGVPYLNNSQNNSSIWLSNKLVSKKNFYKFNNLNYNLGLNLNSTVNNYLTSYNNINLNNFENSFFWVVNRFKFLQSMPNNNQFINFITKPNTSTPVNNITLQQTQKNVLLYDYYTSQKSLTFYRFMNINSIKSPSTLGANYAVQPLWLSSDNYDLLNISDINFIGNCYTSSLPSSNNMSFFSNLY